MSANWSDLRARILSAIAMLVVGIAALWSGGIWFACLIAICAALMTWELATMVGSSGVTSVGLGGLGGIAAISILAATKTDATGWAYNLLPFVMVLPALAGAVILENYKRLFGAYSIAITIACAALLMFREIGVQSITLLIAIVVITDVAGYFAGRMLGGPKFWPRISPKKTWSGTVAGWIGAGVLMAIYSFSFASVLFGIALSFSSQMGDIAESALKRKMGIKDSSNLIPGHGGLLDRFDGLIGASIAMIVLLVLGLHP